jgi:hypothetical protein
MNKRERGGGEKEDISKSSAVLGQNFACGADSRDHSVCKGIWGLGPFTRSDKAEEPLNRLKK